MRHFRPSFAFLRTEKDRWAFAEGLEEGFESLSSPPPEGNYFWAPDFFLEDEKPFLRAKRFAIMNTSELRECLQALTSSPFSSPYRFEDLNWEVSPKERYQKSFSDLKNLFEQNVLEKSVPVVIDKGSLKEGDLKDSMRTSLLFFFDQMARLPESLTPFFLADREWIFGATPETLVLKKGNQLKTHAVAGTTDDLAKDLLNDPKEISEHNYVVREMERILSAYGVVKVKNTAEKVLPTLKHLITEMELSFSEANFNSVIELALNLHPTPALGGYPKNKAFEWLKEQPDSKLRRRYGAPFGYVSAGGDSHIVVAIRALQVVDHSLLSIAGAGVVKESVFQNEWQEISAKKKSVFKIFEESASL